MTVETTAGTLQPNSQGLLRRLSLIAYAVGVVAFVVFHGVPTDRIMLMSLVVCGLCIASIGSGRRRLVRIIADWLPFTLVLLVYDLSRGLSDATGLPLHEHDIVGLERFLFAGHIPTLYLQHHFYDPAHVHWYDALATLVYTSHFVATPVLAAVLWLRDRTVWISYIARVVVLSFAGLITYVLFPEAPPWYAARDHLISPVQRLSARGWVWLHFDHVTNVLATAQNEGSNPVAAMPSLHTAFATLVALFVAGRIASRWRYLLFVYPVLMGLTLVYTGEHYVVDVVAGIVFALAVHRVIGQWERNRAAVSEALRPDGAGSGPSALEDVEAHPVRSGV